MKIEEFKKLFLNHFGEGIDKAFLDQHVYGDGNYPWHIFSFEVKDKTLYCEGLKAKEMYDKVDKRKAIVFNPFSEESFDALPNYSYFSDLQKFIEVYVYDQDFQWAFFFTHEEGLGPYYIEKG